ncbi:hypothetical protein [Natronoglomus mannanivorans]|uniref:Uncharacterized protein n=1 Tax=Natronoglomus mannanivorans TaxID=2979990 RepID=A0AAP2Z3J1_9EURY|nr:hypothetical protein [Halobacteria archaeon AArc-xg1-1]
MSASDPSDEETAERRFQDEVYEDVGDAIPRLLNCQQTVVGTLNRFRQDHLNGDRIQPTLNDSLQQIDEELPFLLYLLDVHGVEEMIDVLVADGCLDADRQAEAVNLCRQIEWAAPAGEAYLQSRRGFDYWTSTAMGFAGFTESGNLLLGQRAKQGVDELWDVQAPPSEFGELVLTEVVHLVDVLEQLPADGNVSEAEVTNLRQIVDALDDQIGELDRAVDDLEQLHRSDSTEDYDDLLE